MNDWRLLPLAAGAWLGAALGTGLLWWGVAASVVAAVLSLFVAARRPWLVVGLVACAVVATGSGLLAEQRHSSTLARLAEQRAIVTAEVRITAEPRPRAAAPPKPPSVTALAEVRWVEARGTRTTQRLPVLLVASGDRAETLRGLAVGSSQRVQARLAAGRVGEQAVALLSLREVVAEGSPPGPHERLAAWLRQGLRDAVANAPPGQRALVPSLVVGDTSLVGEELRDQFQATGLTHLMAVSGANLALMLGVVLALLRMVGVRGWSVRWSSLATVVLFVLICGPEPSVLRAAAMGLVAVAATGMGTGRRSIRGLCVAVVVLIGLDPWLARAPGFWLSCAACLGIVVLGPQLVRSMTTWAPRWLAEALAVPCAAQLWTQPIVTALSGEVSVVGVLANVVAGPFVGPTTVLGFAACALSWWPSASALLGRLAGISAQPLLWIAERGAGLPGATTSWPPGTLGLALVTVLCAALAALAPAVMRRRATCLLLLLGLLGASVVRAPTPGWPGPWQVVACDVGQGDATVLRAGDGQAVLVDTGQDPAPVLACLDRLGVRSLPLVVLTHFHADHVGAFDAVARRHPPGLVLTSATPSPSGIARAVTRAAGSAVVRAAQPGERLRVGDVTWTTIAAPEHHVPASADGEGESSAENDASVVGVADVAGLTVLLPGDVEPAGQRDALRTARRLGLTLRADVAKLPHHGSARQEEAFLAATGARLALVSAGEDNAYGHPAPSALTLVGRLGMEVARTDTEGAIALAERDALEVRRLGR
ncbi:ComEC/Rec2 family competence protein [uncultured Tessaracoccus sp.]|uniref:ComEC/Rec2 family competence protein n=1 Tax=uncultured Tessaracoccus sp. TaxID=905023 RepID=UPI0025E3F70D|nr:ComEC/Rec2 family competence protein [uncultured Tessaracoccus sp.]